MPIQFLCPSCSQPIEVDDEVAGSSATCPYCQRVVSVPTESTYNPQQPPAARPVPPEGEDVPEAPGPPTPPAPPPPPPGYGPSYPGSPPPSLHVGPQPRDRARQARSYGNYGLICGIITAALFVASQVVAQPLQDQLGPTSRPTQEEMMKLMEQPAFRQTTVLYCSAFFFAVIGLAVSFLSLRASRSGNWRGWVGLCLCALPFVLFCLSAFLLLAGGGFPAG